MQKQKRPPLVLRQLFIIGFSSLGSLAVLLKLPHPFWFFMAGIIPGSLAILIWPDRFGIPEFRPVLKRMFQLMQRPASARR